MTRYFLLLYLVIALPSFLGRPRFFTMDITFALCCNSRCIRLRLSTFIKYVAHEMQRKIGMPAIDVTHTSADLFFLQTSQLYFMSNNRRLPTKRVNSSSVKFRAFIHISFLFNCQRIQTACAALAAPCCSRPTMRYDPHCRLMRGATNVAASSSLVYFVASVSFGLKRANRTRKLSHICANIANCQQCYFNLKTKNSHHTDKHAPTKPLQ